MKNLTSLLILVLAALCAQAQIQINEDGDDPFEKRNYFSSGLNYLSNNVYLGRKDTLVIPYYSPYFGYHFKDGFYLKAMLSFTPVNGTHLDLTTLEAGYDHSFSDHFTAGISADKFIYNKNSVSIRANTVASAGVFGQFSNDYLEPTVTADVNFNHHSTDYVTGLMLDHDFQLANKKIHLLPAVTANLGTQNYLDEYYVSRITKKEKVKLDKVLANSDRFVPLDYELSCKATYMTPAWLFTIMPTYAIPVSPAALKLPGGKVTEEKLSNSFFVELDVCHR